MKWQKPFNLLVMHVQGSASQDPQRTVAGWEVAFAI